MVDLLTGSARVADWQQAGLLWLLRATVLCVVAAGASALIQKRSADIAYRVWIGALAGALLLPLFGVIVPGWSVKVNCLRSPEAETLSSVAAPFTTVSEKETSGTNAVALRSVQGRKEFTMSDQASDRIAASSYIREPVAKAIDAAGTPPNWDKVRMLSWIDIVCVIWVVVAFVLLLRLVIAALNLMQLVQRSSPAPAALQSQVIAVASSLGVRIRCQVRLLPAGSMPMACWVGRPVILLPEDIGRWPTELARTAMAHELGHLERRDVWSNLLGQVVWRLLWPHPVLWHVRHVLPHLRERACDEWVLARGLVSKHEYARHLLEVIGRCQPAKLRLAAQMAARPDLEERLRSILAVRRASGRSALAKVSIAFSTFLLTAILAAARPAFQEPAVAQGSEETSSLQKSDATATERGTEPAAPDGPAITIAGVVVSPDAKPVKDASVVLRAKINGRCIQAAVASPPAGAVAMCWRARRPMLWAALRLTRSQSPREWRM